MVLSGGPSCLGISYIPLKVQHGMSCMEHYEYPVEIMGCLIQMVDCRGTAINVKLYILCLISTLYQVIHGLGT